MSELLGWYGYEKVDSRCTHGLNLNHFTSSTSPKRYRHHQRLPQLHSRITESDCSTSKNSNDYCKRQRRESRSPQSPSTSSISIVTNKESDVAQVSSPLSLTTAPASPRALEHSDSTSDAPDSSTTCSWCGRAGGAWEPGSATLPCGINNNAERFCSETCFAAGRRAAFKRAKTCDWCRHVRHSVSYVDFQDGETQLQFCSDKCLNQYKMNIFCHETQAHLAIHGVANLSSNNPNTSGGLITPELWLKDCRSPPPRSENHTVIVDDELTIWPTTCTEKLNHIEKVSLKNDEKQFLIETIAPTISSETQQTHNSDDTINDIFDEETEEAIRESLKDEEKRRFQKCKTEINSVKSFHTRTDSNLSISCGQSRTSPMSLKESSSDRIREGTIYLKDVRKLLDKDIGQIRHQTSGYRSRKISKSPTGHSEHQINYRPSPRSVAAIHHPFLQHPTPLKFTPRHGNFPVSSPTSIVPPSIHSIHQKPLTTNLQTGFLPPVTVLVPYPIPIPIPLPIPIPIPLFDKFFNSNNYNLCETKRQVNTTIDTAVGANTEIPIVPEDLSQRSQTITSQMKNIAKHNQFSNVADESAALLNSCTSPLPSIASTTSCSSLSTTHTTDMLPVLQIASTNINGRPLRKRQRQSTAADQIDMRLKRRNKFVPA